MPTRDTVNVMAVKRDVKDGYQQSKSCGERVEPAPRLAPQGPRPAHTRAVVSLDGSRCIVIIDTGAEVFLVSACIWRAGVNYQPWSERDGRITGGTQQGIAVLGRVVLEVHLVSVKVLTTFIVAVDVGIDAIIGVAI